MADPADIRADYTRQAERIAARRDLTQQAKEVLTARAYVRARDALAAAQQQATERIQATRRAAERTLFGAPSTSSPAEAISRRDAQDRATRITDATDALALLRRAERHGDEHLAQAIAARAVEHPMNQEWARVLDEYVATRPAAAEALATLRELPTPDSAEYALSMAIEYALIPGGALASVRTEAIDRIAQVDLDAA